MSRSQESNISVVTVNYNSSVNTNTLIKSLIRIDTYINEIIVIDNNSKDIQELNVNGKVKIIKNNKNLGFAAAVNQGIKSAKSKYILLINPDCYLENKSILKSLNKIINNPKIGAIGGKIKKADENKYHMTANSKPTFLTGLFEFTNLKKIFPNNKFTNKFWIEKTYKSNKPKRVNSLCGAYIILKKIIKNKFNLFDERYFLYMEDIDFGDKINKLRYYVIFDPESEITHIGGASSGSKYGTVLKHWYVSRKKYFKKHLNPIESTILTIVFIIEEKFLWIYHKIKAEPYE